MKDVYRIEDWNRCSSMLKGEWYPKEYADIVPALIKKAAIVTTIKTGEKLYRARIFDDIKKSVRSINTCFKGFGPEESLAPKPEHVTRENRANSTFESVLYTANDINTTIAEIRPQKGQYVSVAELEVLNDLRIVELLFKEDPSKHDERIKEILYDMALCFYIPVHEGNKEYYKVTQYISDIVKRIKCQGSSSQPKEEEKMKYQGIKYSSSQSDKGENIVIFDESNVKVVKTDVYQIKGIDYSCIKPF